MVDPANSTGGTPPLVPPSEGANIESAKKDLRLTAADTFQETSSSERVAWQDFGTIKAGGIMGLIARGLKLNEDSLHSIDDYKLPKEAKDLPANTQKLIRTKIHELIEQKDEKITFEKESGISSHKYDVKGSTFVYGVCNFTIRAGDKTTTLTIEIPTNFHPNEVRDFTNRNILNNKETQRLKDELVLAKAGGDENKIKDAREKLKTHLEDIKDNSPGKLDAEKFIEIVSESLRSDAEKVRDATGDTLKIEGKPIGDWLKAGHVKMNVSEGTIESFYKNHTFTALSFKDADITKIFNDNTFSFPEHPSPKELKNRVLARQIRDDIANSLGKQSSEDLLDEYIAEQIRALEVLMLRRECEEAKSKEAKNLRKEMKNIVTIINTLQTGKKKGGKTPKGLWAQILHAKSSLQESLPNIPFLSKAKYEAPLLSEAQAKILVEAEGIVKGYSNEPAAAATPGNAPAESDDDASEIDEAERINPATLSDLDSDFPL